MSEFLVNSRDQAAKKSLICMTAAADFKLGQTTTYTSRFNRTLNVKYMGRLKYVHTLPQSARVPKEALNLTINQVPS